MHQPEHTAHAVRRRRKHQSADRCRTCSPGAEADIADNGLQAPAHPHRHYAIVFTDGMPVMDGATLTHILRSDSRYGELPIIACTAISSPEEEEALLQKGFTAVLRKPFDVQAMQTALNRHATLSGEAPAPSPEPRPRVEAGHAIREEPEHLPVFPYGKGLIGRATFPCTSVSCSISGASLPKPTPRSGRPGCGTICPPSGRPSTN
ncbi:MAG: response regulator [Bilophila wadsworthia]